MTTSNRIPFKLQLDADYLAAREKELLIEDILAIIPQLTQKERLDLQNRVNEACSKAYYQS